MDKSDVTITIPGVIQAASVLHRARVTRPDLDEWLHKTEIHLAATPAGGGDEGAYERARATWSDARDACAANTDDRIRAAVELVEASKLELLQAVYDAATDDDWPLRELAQAACVARGTVANLLSAGGVTTSRSR